MPRRLERKARKTGYMYFDVSKVRSNMSIDEILDIIFSRCEEYKRIAKTILEGVKEISINNDRKNLSINSQEMSQLINEKLSSKKKSITYRVLSEFLIPMGLITYRREDGTYTIGNDFRVALNRIASSYTRWMKI